MSTNKISDDLIVVGAVVFGIVLGVVGSSVADKFAPPITEKSHCIEDVHRPRESDSRQGDKPIVVVLRSCSMEELERESKIRHMDDKP